MRPYFIRDMSLKTSIPHLRVEPQQHPNSLMVLEIKQEIEKNEYMIDAWMDSHLDASSCHHLVPNYIDLGKIARCFGRREFDISMLSDSLDSLIETIETYSKEAIVHRDRLTELLKTKEGIFELYYAHGNNEEICGHGVLQSDMRSITNIGVQIIQDFNRYIETNHDTINVLSGSHESWNYQQIYHLIRLKRRLNMKIHKILPEPNRIDSDFKFTNVTLLVATPHDCLEETTITG